MRSYIFTERERRIVEAMLRGETVSRLEVAKIRHRLRRFTRLRNDVDLYLALVKLTETETAKST
jgi:hypothetical protein